MSEKDPQSRKWFLTINNPLQYGFDHDKIKEELSKMKPVLYWCMSDEIGIKGGTYHTHIFIACANGVRFSTVKNRFPKANIEFAKGTSQQNKDYIFKEGEKWETSKKKETNLPNTHEEWGEMPIERPGRKCELTEIYDLIKQGCSNYDILEQCPEIMPLIDKIDKIRMTIKQEEFKNTIRNIETVYIWGETGTGKTRYIMDKYGYENVYRITDKNHPFDGYSYQDVITFEEFCGQFKIQDMLNYLDIYPLELPARYNNKVACYTKVFLTSNMDLLDLYPDVRRRQTKTWAAFIRRIHKVIVFGKNGCIKEYTAKEYINNTDKRRNKEEDKNKIIL